MTARTRFPRGSVRALATLVFLAVTAGAVSAAVTTPTIEGPITSPGGAFLPTSTTFDLAQVGYTEAEYFISGTASAYTSAVPLTSDGLWSATPGATAAYKTRILVYRPATPRKFNGTVVVEWLNVSAGIEAPPDWVGAHTELIRAGFAWVGVSAQIVGVEGGTPLIPGLLNLPLKTANPVRYGSLHHPGDSFSYDMFSQAGAAVRDPSGPFHDLRVKRVIAAGDSQSAFRLVTYIDAIHPLVHVYDGYLVHSRGGGGPLLGADLSQALQPVIEVPTPTFIRSDIDVPVLDLETETDLTFLGYFAARQDDSAHFRLWEVAGTSHADTYGLVNGPSDLGTSPAIVAPIITTSATIINCQAPLNSGPQHFVLSAAFAALDRWMRRGRPPRSAPRLEVAAGPPPAIMDDGNGNALGGIRTPQVDVPIARFTGLQGGGSLICLLLGTTTLFDPATLATLYPSHEQFVVAYKKSLRRAVRDRFILGADAKLIRKWAEESSIGR
jgi:hypothetical protein